MLPQKREQELAELAEFVANEYCPKGFVRPEVIIEANDITKSFGSYGDTFDGLLECKGNRFHIFYNRDRLGYATSPRARFTLGHELGHYYIDEHRNALLAGADPHGSVCDFVSGLLVEQEADFFSSNLLLPRSRFAAAASRASRGMSGVLALKEEFQTSITSTALRYVIEDLVPCTLIKWTPSGFGWKRFSPATYAARYRKTIEEMNRIPLDSATAEALAGAQAPGSGFFRKGSAAAVWFPFLDYGSARNVVMMEEAVRLGEYGVLTLLYPADGEY